MRFSVFQLSQRGTREKNEDRMGYCYSREACLLVLADGMGGHAHGEVAAQIALRTFSALFQRQATPLLADAQAFLVDALLQAHEQILLHASEHRLRDAPRTTLVAAVLQQGKVSWIHCGDSRLYLVRGGALLARTLDHSYSEMARRTLESPLSLGSPNASASSLTKVPRNLLFSCLGSPTQPIHDLGGPTALVPGDRLLLCSDGLWEQLSEAELLEALAHGPVSLCVPRMVDAALQRGGRSSDNVTAIALEWQGSGLKESHDSISTETLQSDMFQSTIQPGPLEAFEDELSEAAIERSIAEINAAIRRSAERKH